MTSYRNSAIFLKTLKEALIAYSFDIGGLFAGFIVASQLNIFQLSPWAIALYPAIVSAKGVIVGLLSGRLSTALHIGTIYPRLFGNTPSFYRLTSAIIVITMAASVVMSLVSLVFGSLFWGVTFEDFPVILLIIVTTMAFGMMLTVITINVAFITFKKGVDPDVIVYPVMSTVADIFITLCYVLVLNLYFFAEFGMYTLILIGLAHIILLLRVLLRNIREEDFVRTIKEALVTMMFVAVIVNVTGTVLKKISTIVENRREIYTVYPPLIDIVGDVGSVTGSTATTKLALGLLKPSFSSIRHHALQIFSAWTASMIIVMLLAVLSLSLNTVVTLNAFLGLASLLAIANLIAGVVIIMVSYAISIVTFKRGLDPDNFVIPIESSLADSVTSIALLVALVFVG